MSSVSKFAYNAVLGAAGLSAFAFGTLPKCNAPGLLLLLLRFGGYFALYGAIATWIRWLLMVPPQRTPTPKEVAKAVAAGAPIAPIDPRMLLSAQQMSQDLRAGKYTSVELVDLFIAHIERVDRRAVNAVVCRRFDEARAEARHADKVLAEARSGTRDWATVGWLTGVPCSIKECYALTGMPSCVGHPMRAPGAPASAAESTAAFGFSPALSVTDAPAVARLRAAGAIPLGVTNTSELCMWLESNNRVYGTTCNPYDARCLVGGSSGGEAAAVSGVYAPFGLGSDIGGSIRLPSMFCGTFGHKPSTRLVPNRGQMPGVRDRGHNILVSGPITRHADDLWPLMKTLVEGGFLEDPSLARFPLPPPLEEQLASHEAARGAATSARITAPSDITLDSSVTVYAVEDLNLPGTFVSDEQRRAVRATAAQLEAAYGCKVHIVDWRRPETVPAGWKAMRAALKYWNACMNQDQNTYVKFLQGGYNASPSEADARRPSAYGVFREVGKWFAGRSRHTFPSVVLGAAETLEKNFLTKTDLTAHVAESDALSHAISKTLGLKGVMICPGFPHVAAKHHAFKLLSLGFTYTALFNALQVPVTSVPVWHSQDADKQRLPCGVQVVGAYGNDVMTLCVAEGLARAGPAAHQCKVPQWMTVSKSVPQ